MKCIGTAKTDGDLFSLTFSSEPPYRFGPGRKWNLSAPGHSTWGNLYTRQISFPNSRIFPSTSIQHAVYGGTCTDNVHKIQVCAWIRIQTGTEFSQFVDPDPYSEYGPTSTQVKIWYTGGKWCKIEGKIHHSETETQLTKNVFRCHDCLTVF